MTTILISTVIGKNEDGSDITQDVDVLVWWRDVGHLGKGEFPEGFDHAERGRLGDWDVYE
jgi:hypothetical protein